MFITILFALMSANPCPAFRFNDKEDVWDWEKRVERTQKDLGRTEKLKVVWRGLWLEKLVQPKPPSAMYVVLQRANCETMELKTDAGHWSDRPGSPKDKWDDRRYPIGSSIETCRIRWRHGRDGHLFGAEVETTLQRILEACGDP